MTRRIPFNFDSVKSCPLLVTVALVAILLIVRPQLTSLKETTALLYLNLAMNEGPDTLATRVSRIESAKALLHDTVPDKDIARVTHKLDLSHTNITLHDLVGIGDHYFQLGDLSHAERWYRYSAQWYPASGAAWYRLGYTYENRNNLQPAISAYRKSINVESLPELGVGESDPYCRLGSVLREHETVRDLHQARDYLRSGINLDNFGSPEAESECYFELANTLRWQRASIDEYIELYRKAVSTNPEHVQANILLAVTTYQLTGNIDESETYIRQSLSARPTVRAFQELAKMYEKEGEYEQALTLYRAALDLAISNEAIPAIEAAISRLQARQNTDDN